MKPVVNIICGAQNGGFRMNYRHENSSREIKIPMKDLAHGVRKALRTITARYDIGHVMFSSSMDFPEDYGVTNQQVERFNKALQTCFV